MILVVTNSYLGCFYIFESTLTGAVQVDVGPSGVGDVVASSRLMQA